jgi:hypothetical protein
MSGGIIDRSPMLGAAALMTMALLGVGILALPIALWPFGPLVAGLLVLALGLVNAFTITALATAIARSNAVVSGRGRIISITGESLGRRAAAVISSIGTMYPFLALITYSVAVITTLPDLLGGSRWAWAFGLGALTVVMVALQAKRLLYASATVVSVINLAVMSGLIVAIATRIDTSLLTNGPDIGAAGGLSAALGLVFGTILFTFFGHTSLFLIAQPSLRADPTGRSLRRGSLFAMAVVTVANVAWVVVTLSAVPPAAFDGVVSTGLDLLSEVGGPAVLVLGTAFVIGSAGYAAVNSSFELANAVDERLPRLRHLSTIIRPGSSVEVLDPQTAATIVINRVEDQLVAVGHFGRQRVRQIIGPDGFDGTEMLNELGAERHGVWVRLDSLGDVGDGLAVDIETSMAIRELAPERSRHDFVGASTDDELEHRIVICCVRRPSTIAEIAERVGIDEAHADQVVAELVAARRLHAEADGTYGAALGTRQRASSAVVAALFTELEAEEAERANSQASADAPAVTGRNETRHVPDALNSVPIRRLIVTAPVAVAAVTSSGLVSAEIGFTAVVSLVAMTMIMVLGAGLPLLLNMSYAARAERAVKVGALLGSRVLNRVLFWFFIGVIALYATVIYSDWVGRIAAFGVGAVMVWLYVTAARRGAFRPRSAILVETTAGRELRASAVASGTPQTIIAPDELDPGARRLELRVPGGLASPIRICALDGETVPVRLGRYTATSADGVRVTGRLEDSVGDEVMLGDGEIHIIWQLG